MSRISDGAARSVFIATVVIAALLGSACEEIKGRNGNRQGNRLFREMQFVDAAAEYEEALKLVPDPIIHYNLGLAYSKIYIPSYEKPILLGEATDPICKSIPGTVPHERQVCVKKPDAEDQNDRRRFNECKEQGDCASSFTCKKTTLCTALSPQLAQLAADHLQAWIKAQPSDEVLAAELKKVRDEIKVRQADHEARLAKLPPGDEEAKAAEIQRAKSSMDELNIKVDELTLKEDMRNLMTQAWLDTAQFDRALAYWQSELDAKQGNTGVMGKIAGIHLKAGDWRKSIEWYHKVADLEKDPDLKVSALSSIGNVAWAKLNSKAMTIDENMEIADFGMGALQEATQVQPKLAKLWGLQVAIMNFRSLNHGASFAAAIDRSNAQDLQRLTRVLIDEAKKKKAEATPSAPPATTPAPPAPTPGGPPAPAPGTPAPAAPKSGG